MPAHFWSTENDFEYCQLENCTFKGTGIVLDGATSGTIVSDIRHSTDRIYKYDEFIPHFSLNPGGNLQLYYRVGLSPDIMTDWISYPGPENRVEYTVSLTDARIIADYDIAELVNIYTEFDYRYKILWDARTDFATVDFALVDYDPSEITAYAVDTVVNKNVVNLSTLLDENNVNIALEYIPRHFVVDDRLPYIQWKADLTADAVENSPLLRSVSIGYSLNFTQEMQDAFPLFYRRV